MSNVPICYIVDDDEKVRELLRVSVSAMGVEAASFGSASEFLAGYDPQRLGCLVVNMRLPGTSGLDLLKQLRARQADIATIMISSQATVGDAVEAMKWGAVDFLEKPYALSALRGSIERALACEQQRRAGEAAVDRQRQRVSCLTDAERAVVWLTASGDPDKRIAAKLDISPRTVQLRRASAMKKLRVQNRVDIVRLVGATPADLWINSSANCANSAGWTSGGECLN